MPKQTAYVLSACRANTEAHPPKELGFNTSQIVTLGVMLMSYHLNSPMDVSSLFAYELSTRTTKTSSVPCVISKKFLKQAS